MKNIILISIALPLLALSSITNADDIADVEVVENRITWNGETTGWVQVQDTDSWQTVSNCEGIIDHCDIPGDWESENYNFAITDHNSFDPTTGRPVRTIVTVNLEGCEALYTAPQLSCDATTAVSIESATVNGDALEVVLNNPDGVKIDAHLSLSPQPANDGAFENGLGDTVNIGAVESFTFGTLPIGQYNAYLRVRYTYNDFADNDTTIADGRFVDLTVNVDIHAPDTNVPTVSITSAVVNGNALDVVLSNPSGAKIDAHLSSNPQPAADGSYGNDLGDTVSIGAVNEFTFGSLPAGQYNAYLRVRYSVNDFSDNSTTIADGRYADYTVTVDSSEPDGYVSFLDVSGPIRPMGTISNDDLDDMVNPLNVYWRDSDVNTSGLSTQNRSGRRALQVRVNPTPSDNSGTDRFAAGMDLRGFSEKEMWLSQYILHPSGHDFKDRGKVGVGLFVGDATSSGGNPKSNGGSVRVTWRVYNGVGNWGLYLYTADQPANTYGLELYDLNGNSTKGELPYNRGNLSPISTEVWVHHETRVVLNTAHERSDGILQHWIDGVLVKDLDNVRWLTSGNLKFLAATAGNFYGGSNRFPGEFSPNGPQDIFLADWELKR